MKGTEKFYSFISKNIDKVAHVAVSTILFIAIALLFHKAGIVKVGVCQGLSCVVTLVIGIGKEYCDRKRGENFDIKDITADIVGIVIGILITFLI